jgi:hypothetical protein
MVLGPISVRFSKAASMIDSSATCCIQIPPRPGPDACRFRRILERGSRFQSRLAAKLNNFLPFCSQSAPKLAKCVPTGVDGLFHQSTQGR